MKIYGNIVVVAILLSVASVQSQTCNANGFYCLSCEEYGQCVDDVPSPETMLCPAGTVCNQDSMFECDPGAVCTTPTTTIAPGTCTAGGRFADPDSLDCQGYYTCMEDTINGGFIKYNYTCPGTSMFDPSTSKCTANYVCPSSRVESSSVAPETTTLPPETTTIASTSTSTVATTTPGPFVCPAAGVYADPVDCRSYYRCTSTLVAYKYTCPGESSFDPTTSKCVSKPCPPPTTTAAPVKVAQSEWDEELDYDVKLLGHGLGFNWHGSLFNNIETEDLISTEDLMLDDPVEFIGKKKFPSQVPGVPAHVEQVQYSPAYKFIQMMKDMLKVIFQLFQGNNPPFK